MQAMWIYLCATGFVTALLAMLRSPSGDTASSDEVFRYDPNSLRLMLFCVPAIAVLLAVGVIGVEATGGPRRPYVFIAVAWFVVLAVGLAYAYCKTYRVVAKSDHLVVRDCFRSRSIAYQDIKEVVLKEGAGRGGSLLSINGFNGKRLLAATSSFDFLGLSGAIRSKAARYSVVYRHRDAYGKWS